MRRPHGRGYSLIEIVLASALLMVLGLITASMVQSGLKSSEMGRLNVDAQNSARLAIKRVSEDIAAATRFTALDPEMPSGVLCPSTVYPYACNKLALIIPTLASARDLASVATTSSFSLVVYSVEGPSSSQWGNKLKRAVYPFNGVSQATLQMALHNDSSENAPTLPSTIPKIESNDQEARRPMFPACLYKRSFAPQGSAITPPSKATVNHWWADPGTVGATLGVTPRVENIVELAGSTDTVQLMVSHKQLVDPAQDRYNTINVQPVLYERSNYFVDVWVRRQYRDDNTQIPVIKQFSETVVVADTGG